MDQKISNKVLSEITILMHRDIINLFQANFNIIFTTKNFNNNFKLLQNRKLQYYVCFNN